MNPNFIQTTPHWAPNPSRSRTFTVNFFSKPITTVVTATPAVAREWVYTLRRTHRRDLSNSALVVGLGVQWRPTFSYAALPEAATIQLCVDSECLIFQLCHASAVPATLRRLLADERVTFVGVHNGRDRTLLEGSWHELEVEATVVDMAADQGWGNASMEEMAAEVLGLHGVVKPQWLGVSDWDAVWLSNEQVQYACVDALVSYLLAMEFGYPGCMYDDDDDDDNNGDDDDDCDDLWGEYGNDNFCNYYDYGDDDGGDFWSDDDESDWW